eukprot:TRINITY_DN16992_c0_g1_i1.p1 TRINITY_DN16992_c0_g1~~TRINITY_DN16992_c0_g1_i1.p1  ORF type:complete len:175 (+),score=29.25 TRINITY_DN16992_c0_g1_i1:168-692(+)
MFDFQWCDIRAISQPGSSNDTSPSATDDGTLFSSLGSSVLGIPTQVLMYGGVVVLLLTLIIACGCCLWKCCGRKKKKTKMPKQHDTGFMADTIKTMMLFNSLSGMKSPRTEYPPSPSSHQHTPLPYPHQEYRPRPPSSWSDYYTRNDFEPHPRSSRQPRIHPSRPHRPLTPPPD